MSDQNVTKENFSTVRDNMTINGLYFKSGGTDLPIAIVSHGFMANYRTTKGYAQWFAERGYAAFCFDFNGGCVRGRSDKDTTKMTIFTEAEDLKAVINYAQSLPETADSPVLLMGCSQGGVVSGLVAKDLQQQVSPLILFYPALCIPDDARAGKMISAKFDPENIPETMRCGFMKIGREYAASVMDIDLVAMLSQYDGDVLIVHGTNDKIVDYHYSERMAEAYPHAELKLIPHAKHGFSRRDDKTALSYVDEFLGHAVS